MKVVSDNFKGNKNNVEFATVIVTFGGVCVCMI